MSTIDAAIIKHITEGGSGSGGEDKFVQVPNQQVSVDTNGTFSIIIDVEHCIKPGMILRVFNKETQQTEDYFCVIYNSFGRSSKPSSESGLFVPFSNNKLSWQAMNGCFQFYFWQSDRYAHTMEIKTASNYEIDTSQGHGLLLAEEYSPATIAKIIQSQAVTFYYIFQKLT